MSPYYLFPHPFVFVVEKEFKCCALFSATCFSAFSLCFAFCVGFMPYLPLCLFSGYLLIGIFWSYSVVGSTSLSWFHNNPFLLLLWLLFNLRWTPSRKSKQNGKRIGGVHKSLHGGMRPSSKLWTIRTKSLTLNPQENVATETS